MDLSEKGVFKMTLEEALRFIDPETDMDALAEVEYYNGFKGKEAAAKTLREASQMVVDFVRRVSWHDAKTPPPVHDESWENAGEKHCCIMSELVWVCCESRNTSSGWIPRRKSENPPVRQIAPSSLSRWGISRSRKSRGWKNELPVL